MTAGLDTDSRTAWISQGFEHLIDRVLQDPTAVHLDVVIIGSGYGGSIAAATFAGRSKAGAPVRVGVLERGKEYLPGSFPTGLGELPRHIRREGNKEGLFDIRLGMEVTTVVANGVGGGSLVNAGVMEVPLPTVFESRWPSQLSNAANWGSFFDRAADLLGARVSGAPNFITNHADGVPQKFRSIRDIAPANSFRPAAITVAMADSTSSGNVQLYKCVRCGDCATGCNFGAKNSLDVNLLVRAQQNGAEIFSGATVLSIEQDGTNWIVNCVHTNATLRKRHGEIVRIRAGKVVVAAGTLGSSEILMRSSSAGLPLSSSRLGQSCSTNGDMLITDYATAATVNTVSDETVRPSGRAIGPTITGIIDLRESQGVLIEEMSVPASLRLAFTEVFATVNALHGLDTIDWSTHRQGFPNDDAYVSSNRRVEDSALYAVMGDDGAAGIIQLAGPETMESDGITYLTWNGLPNLSIFDEQQRVVSNLTKNSGGRTIANPVWKLLPPELSWLLQHKRGPLTTVHPLGGCAMGDSGATGVVDHLGRVFINEGSSAVYDGLVVLDGSIAPTALGTNPALTIAAVALRAAEALAADWGYDAAQPAPAAAPLIRPVSRATDVAAVPPRTEVEIIERLVGPVRLRPRRSSVGDYVVELTLRFRPKALADLAPGNGGDGTLQVATDQSDLLARSAIRIFPRDKWDELEKSWHPAALKEQLLDAVALFSAPLSGSLKVFERQPSWSLGRIWRAGKAWVLNRGLRDIYQSITDGDRGPGPFSRIRSGLALASHSGALRSLVYELKIGAADAGSKIVLAGDRIVGVKTFTYDRRCNPWRQLMEVALQRFPGAERSTNPVLQLDLGYLARIGVPLARLVRERDGVSAIGDLITFLGYFLRLLLGQHIWSFRAPDKDIDPANDVIDFNPPRRLQLPRGGSVAAETVRLSIDPEQPDLGGDPVPGEVKLTRYPHPQTSKRSVVMLHGYSAGGTTFAHHAVNPNFASHLWSSGRDVWIADLRTSPAYGATAVKAWSFDQIAAEDVRRVIEKAAQSSLDGKVDVVAHCMGTIVFSMAALGKPKAGMKELHELVDRVAFTQVGPLVVFTPANIFRAYATRYVVDFLPDKYEFKPKHPTIVDDLWDRILSTLPYPVEEFDIENPLWPTKRTPWTRTRHRMDVLYGRDFNVANMEPEMLRFIDEHFGALSLKTVSTTLHFARYALMTNHQGKNLLVSRAKFREKWPFPTFSVHGAENGLSHVSTVDRMEKILADAGRVYLTPFINPGAGHQDALVGTKRHITFEKVRQFLDAPISKTPTEGETTKTAYPPWIGPIVTEEWSTSVPHSTPALVLRVGSLPSHRAAESVVMLRVQLAGDKLLRPDDPSLPWDLTYVLGHMAIHRSQTLEEEGWDAFVAPLPSSMPGYDASHPGNALLVLLVYDEPRELGVYGYFRADVPKRLVVRFEPIGPQNDREDDQFTFDRFDLTARAALQALHTPPLRAKPDDPGKTNSDQLVFKDFTETEALDLTPEGVVETSRMLMNFKLPNGQALLTRLIQMDNNLLNGVIPYDPPVTGLTTPTAGGTSFSLASCQYPGGFFDGPVAYRSYDRMVDHLEGNLGTRPRFMLFVGDQVYVDPTAGLYDPSRVEDRYRLPYEAWLGQQSVRNALRRAPSFMLLDDHEIDDNWEPIANPDCETNQEKKRKGLDAFSKYQRGMKPDMESFVFDGFHFFMLDTRTARNHRKVGNPNQEELFDPGTMNRLKVWLTTAPEPKFVVSPVMLLPRHRRAVQRDRRLDRANLARIHSDGWDGYPSTLREVLGHIAENKISGVVFLSGDEHRACVATVDLLNAQNAPIVRLHSIHTAAMFAPYPFANSVEEEILADETIDFTHNGKAYHCIVHATRPTTGDGATYFSVRNTGPYWRLDCEFADGTVQPLTL